MIKDKILVVDDDQTTLTLLGDYFNKDYDVSVVSSYNKAIEIYDKKDFDIFIIDISLDDGDGIDLSKIIKSNKKFEFTPIIIISQHDETDYIEKLFNLGVDDYIIKPINLKELSIRIKRRLYVSEYQKKIYYDYKELNQQLIELSNEIDNDKIFKLSEEDYQKNESKFKENSEKIYENIQNTQIFDKKLKDMREKLNKQKMLIDNVKKFLN